MGHPAFPPHILPFASGRGGGAGWPTKSWNSQNSWNSWNLLRPRMQTSNTLEISRLPIIPRIPRFSGPSSTPPVPSWITAKWTPPFGCGDTRSTDGQRPEFTTMTQCSQLVRRLTCYFLLLMKHLRARPYAPTCLIQMSRPPHQPEGDKIRQRG